MLRLTSEERTFFTLVGQAVAANPFSRERTEVDLRIAGLPSGHSDSQRVGTVIEVVRQRIESLESRLRGGLQDLGDQDRHLAANAFLFDVFHRYIVQFDALIEKQLDAGHQSQRVPFAPEAIQLLQRRGFSAPEALRYFELSFQLRRAFFFIQKNLVGCSPCMQKLRESLWNNVFTHNIHWYDRYLWNRMEDFSTLILGPTGAGKGTAAAAIGRSGYIPFDIQKGCFVQSFTDSLISLNLSQFSQTLIESELFGHKKGAFTGAVADYKGVLDRCSQFGSIFLDEIGEVDETVQIKLLQVLQERSFTPVGSHQSHRFSGRVIAATNRPLAQIRSRKILRDDFFYRLCSDVILVPGLAQRIAEDQKELEDLLAHTVARILGKPSAELTGMLLEAIIRQPGIDYSWPGNVRELEQCVRRILLNHRYAPESIAGSDENHFAGAMTSGELDAQGLLAGYCLNLYRRLGTFEAVARQTRLDRRTVKKYIHEGKRLFENQSFGG